MASTCANCGAVIGIDDRYCGECGEAVLKEDNALLESKKSQHGKQTAIGFLKKISVMAGLAFITTFWIGWLWAPHSVMELYAILTGNYWYDDYGYGIFYSRYFTLFSIFILLAVIGDLLTNRDVKLSVIAKSTSVKTVSFLFAVLATPYITGTYGYGDFDLSTNMLISSVVALCSAGFYFLYLVIAARSKRS